MRRSTSTAVLTTLALVAGLSATASAAEPTGFGVRADVRTAATADLPLLVDGSGFGHGVGLSQYGSYAMGLSGFSAQEILAYYYAGTTVLDRPSTTSVPIRVGVLPDRTTTTAITTVGGAARWQLCPTVGTTVTCTVFMVDDAPVVQPAGATWTVGAVVAPGPDAPAGTKPTFGVRTTDGTVLDPGPGARLRLINVDDAGHLRGRVASSSSDVDYFYGFHEFVDGGATFDVVHVVPNIELYLRGLAEVPSSWGVSAPSSLEAQAIAGRTYAVRLHQGGIKTGCQCHILSTPANQNWTAGQKESEPVYGEIWKAAVNATAGRVVAYEDELIATFYSSSHGGRSENIEDSWAYGTTPFPYLQSIEDPWSLTETVTVDGVDVAVGNNRRAWTARVSSAALAALVGLDDVQRVRVLDRTEGGTPRTLELRGTRDGELVTTTWARPSETRKAIAGANLRLDLLDVDGVKLPSSQIVRFRYGPFTDDDGTLFEQAIAFVAAAGIAQGTGPDTYSPATSVTRGQMAQFLAATAAIPSGTADFDDVDATGTFATAIGDVAAAGISQGYPDGTYRPGAVITRAQFASFLARTFGLVASGEAPFGDVEQGGVHAAAIAAVAETGITTGCETDSFCPSQPVTRGQMAQFLRSAVAHATGS